MSWFTTEIAAFHQIAKTAVDLLMVVVAVGLVWTSLPHFQAFWLVEWRIAPESLSLDCMFSIALACISAASSERAV